MAILNREQILECSDLRQETVRVPEWGGEVIVRSLTGLERDQFEQSMIEMRGKRASLKLENTRARLVSLCVIDEQGKRVFSEGDVLALGQKNASALQRVFEVAQKLSGLTESDLQELSENLT